MKRTIQSVWNVSEGQSVTLYDDNEPILYSNVGLLVVSGGVIPRGNVTASAPCVVNYADGHSEQMVVPRYLPKEQSSAT